MIGNYWKNMIEGKREWRQMQSRAKALPKDYQIVYDEIQKYMWKFAGGDGLDFIAIFKDLLGLFETGAADGKKALEVTGEDVAEFSDELLRNAKTYTGSWHDQLNRNVKNRLGREGTEE